MILFFEIVTVNKCKNKKNKSILLADCGLLKIVTQKPLELFTYPALYNYQ